jgi:hypothetical protein
MKITGAEVEVGGRHHSQQGNFASSALAKSSSWRLSIGYDG